MMKKLLLCLCACMLCLAPALPVSAEEAEIKYDAWNTFVHSFQTSDGSTAEMQYMLYIPAAYETDPHLPLITYIPDATYAGSSLNLYKRAACSANWATKDKSAEAPAVLLTIRLSEVGSDVRDPATEPGQIVPLIDSVVARLGLDEDRLYLTGQSMGGILDFALNTAWPDKFAATVYVGCQPGSEVGDEMYNALLAEAAFADQKFIYITSRLDMKAPYGQDAVEQVLIERGIAYGKGYGLDHKAEDLNATVQAVLDQGYPQNFLGFTQLTSTGEGAAEHMQSFKYAYAIDALYTWLLAQSR